MIIPGLCYGGIIYFAIQTIHFVCGHLPKNELSTHAKHHVESEELNQNSTPQHNQHRKTGKKNKSITYTVLEDWIKLENGFCVPDID